MNPFCNDCTTVSWLAVSCQCERTSWPTVHFSEILQKLRTWILPMVCPRFWVVDYLFIYSNRWDLMKSECTMHFYLWWRWWSDTLLWVTLTNHLTMTHGSCHVCVGWWCHRNKHLPEAELRGPLISGMPCYEGVIQPMRFFFAFFCVFPRPGYHKKTWEIKRARIFKSDTLTPDFQSALLL
jgi:hypothetical protein